jgi:hypothetical protein
VKAVSESAEHYRTFVSRYVAEHGEHASKNVRRFDWSAGEK